VSHHFQAGQCFFYDSSWYNYAKSIFQSLNEMLNELFDILFFSKTEVIFENLSVEEWNLASSEGRYRTQLGTLGRLSGLLLWDHNKQRRRYLFIYYHS